LTLISRFDPWLSSVCTCPFKLTFNPYTGCDHGCVYCYAAGYVPRFSDCRPKKDLIPRLRREAAKLRGEIISMSNSSDPYPNLEAEMRLTRGCLDVLSRHDCRIQIVTKSTLVTEDIDILKRVSSMVSVTITTDDDALARIIEPHAPSPSERLAALEALGRNDISTSVRIDPVIPFLNDNPESLIVKVANLGIKHITSSTLKIRPDSWRRLSGALPRVATVLKRLYLVHGERMGGYTYLPRDMRVKLMTSIGKMAQEHGMKFGTCREELSELNTGTCDGSWLLSRIP
jgi:DNA repair photolyase